ncbi:MAG: ABC transporter permease subunit [Candidatus Dormibacteraeota bacterium]|nr:ABC transporter permease subunit [Candidatus Dormibacteraeota bacterium]
MTAAPQWPNSPGAFAGLRSRDGVLTTLRYGLRTHRWALAGVALLGFLSPYTAGASYLAAAGTAAARANFGRQTLALGPQLAYLIPLPLRPDTVAGYLWWKGLTWMTLVFAAWGLAAATGAIRQEEERGLMEAWLASPLGRVRLVLSRAAAFALAAAAAVVITGLGTAAGLAAGKGSIGPGALVEQALPLLGIALVCFGAGLVAAQVATTRRGAVGLGGSVLLALYALDAVARVNRGLDGVAAVSPFHLADLTTAVVPGGRFEGAPTLALYLIAAVLIALGVAAFRERDLGASLLPPRVATASVRRSPSASPFLRLPVLRSLWQQRLGLIGWVLGTMVGAALIVSLARSTGKLLGSASGFTRFVQAAGTSNAATAVVSSVWLSIAALIVAAYAINQTAHWAAEDAEGRLEMEIAQPVPRWAVVAERCATLMVGALLVTALGSVVAAAVAPGQGVHLDPGRLLLATALLALLALTFGALGALVIARLPRVAVPALGVVAVAGFYLPLLAPLLRWPSWALDLSLFHLYGTPLTAGVYWNGLWVMVAVVVLGFGGAMAEMRVREVGR